MARVAGVWVERGRPVPSYLPGALDELTTAGLVTLAEPEQYGPLRRAALSATGETHYEQLVEKYGVATLARAQLDVPEPEHPAGHRLSDTGDRPVPPSVSIAYPGTGVEYQPSEGEIGHEQAREDTTAARPDPRRRKSPSRDTSPAP